MQSARERAIDAWHVLNYLVQDLLVASRSFELLDLLRAKSILSSTLHTGFTRMAYFHLLLALTKVGEFYQRYKRDIPADCRAEFRGFQKWLKSSGLISFRNKYIGHIWDRDTNRPLTEAVVIVHIQRIVGVDRESFLKWVNHHPNTFPETVVSLVEHTRSELAKHHHLKPPDILPSPASPVGDA